MVLAKKLEMSVLIMVNFLRAFELGERFRKQLVVLKENFPKLIRDVRGKGLLNAVEIYPASLAPASAYDLCVALKDRGILTKATHETVVRLTPPLTIRSVQPLSLKFLLQMRQIQYICCCNE